ncbi:MAG: N-acetylneuraminate lyase [Firmicutes bacterium ADurb.Bin099]|nr:MAG: N-acetylneuraminate lyase [Firmicutes bacterium ADurb.Bin099]
MKKCDILVPIFTPFKKDQTVDYKALKKLVRYVLDKGADGLYTTGSSAETFLLTEEERMKTLEVAAKEANGATVVAHVGTPGTALAVMYAKHAKSMGVDAVASVPPFYYLHGHKAIKKYYTDIADACGLKMMIYNIPGATGVDMSVDQINDLLSDDRIYSIKYTAADYYVLNRIAVASKKPIYSGKDEAFASALMAGATGAIGTTMNIYPQAFVQIKAAFDKKDIASAQKLQTKLNNIIQPMIESGAVIQAMKYVSKLAGINCGEARRPFKNLTAEDKKKLEQAVRDNAF